MEVYHYKPSLSRSIQMRRERSGALCLSKFCGSRRFNRLHIQPLNNDYEVCYRSHTRTLRAFQLVFRSPHLCSAGLKETYGHTETETRCEPWKLWPLALHIARDSCPLFRAEDARVRRERISIAMSCGHVWPSGNASASLCDGPALTAKVVASEFPS